MRILTVLRAHWDRTLAATLVLIGAIAITSAAVQARDTILAFEQITLLITGGITGLALIAIGLATWLSADLRDEWRQMKSLETFILATTDQNGVSTDLGTDQLADLTADHLTELRTSRA